MSLSHLRFLQQNLQRQKPDPLICCCSSLSHLFLSPCLFHSPSDELLSSQEKSSGMKDVIVSIDTSKDSDADSSKLSSKATSLQNSPAIQKGG